MKKIGNGMFTVLLMTLFLLTPILAQEAEGAPEPVKESALAGYTLGLNVGYPVAAGETFETGLGPLVGIVGNTPYGFALGPFNIGVGFAAEAVMMELKTQIGISATLNSTVFVTPYGPISLWGGAGYYDGIGAIGGAYLDYMVPNMPLVLKPYARATINTGGGSEGSGTLTGFINVGIMALYDISTLF